MWKKHKISAVVEWCTKKVTMIADQRCQWMEIYGTKTTQWHKFLWSGRVRNRIKIFKSESEWMVVMNSGLKGPYVLKDKS